MFEHHSWRLSLIFLTLLSWEACFASGQAQTIAGNSPQFPLPPPVSDPNAIEPPGEFEALGERDFKAGNYAAAVRDWRHALIDEPNNGGLMLLLAQGLFATGQYEEEQLVTEAAMKLLPQSQWGEVVRNYAELYRGNQDYTDQLRALEKRRKTDDSPGVRFLLGYHYGYLGYPKEAVRELDKALEMEPQFLFASRLRDEFARKIVEAAKQ